MPFWSAVIIIVLGVTIVQAVKEVAKQKTIKNKDLMKLEQNINEIKSELQEIKEYIADLVIKIDQV